MKTGDWWQFSCSCGSDVSVELIESRYVDEFLLEFRHGAYKTSVLSISTDKLSAQQLAKLGIRSVNLWLQKEGIDCTWATNPSEK